MKESNITIMIFCEGTILKPKSIFSLYSHKKYLPIGNAVQKINNWWEQGADIVYCTSRRGIGAEKMSELLKLYGFKGTILYSRERSETYKNIIESIRPNILIEDDCRSIGGSWQMCLTHVSLEVKSSIKSIIVREFKGIDHLPEKLEQLF